MATNYYHAQIGIVTESGDINIIYPVSYGSDVRITPNSHASGATTLQALVNALGAGAFGDGTNAEYLTGAAYDQLTPEEIAAGTFFVTDRESGDIDATLSTSSANAIANSAVATAINQINSDLSELNTWIEHTFSDSAGSLTAYYRITENTDGSKYFEMFGNAYLSTIHGRAITYPISIPIDAATITAVVCQQAGNWSTSAVNVLGKTTSGFTVAIPNVSGLTVAYHVKAIIPT